MKLKREISEEDRSTVRQRLSKESGYTAGLSILHGLSKLYGFDVLYCNVACVSAVHTSRCFYFKHQDRIVDVSVVSHFCIYLQVCRFILSNTLLIKATFLTTSTVKKLP